MRQNEDMVDSESGGESPCAAKAGRVELRSAL
jgi:hypothetical protein